MTHPIFVHVNINILTHTTSGLPVTIDEQNCKPVQVQVSGSFCFEAFKHLLYPNTVTY